MDDTNKLGYSKYDCSSGYKTAKKYNYRKYNIKENKGRLKEMTLEFKNGYKAEE